MDRCFYCRGVFHKKFSTQRFCSLICANRHNRNNSNYVILPTQSSELAEFFGILFGDGGVTRYHTKIYLNAVVDKEYSDYVFALSRKLFSGATVSKRIPIGRGTAEIQISSKVVCDFLRNMGFNKERIIPSWICRNRKYKKVCLRGLVDTEGSVGMKFFNGKNGKYLYKQLTFTNINVNIRSFVRDTFAELGYCPTLGVQKNIYISNVENILNYFKRVGSSNPKLVRKILIREVNGFVWN